MAKDRGQEITIQLRCIELPGAEFDGKRTVRLGVQKGKEVIDDVSAATEEVVFACPLRVEKNPETGKPNFLGQYAQGKPAERFIYLCWGERKAEGWDGFGRVKVHLKELEWHTVEQALATGNPIAATVRMTDQNGKPIYASVRSEHITWHG